MLQTRPELNLRTKGPFSSSESRERERETVVEGERKKREGAQGEGGSRRRWRPRYPSDGQGDELLLRRRGSVRAGSSGSSSPKACCCGRLMSWFGAPYSDLHVPDDWRFVGLLDDIKELKSGVMQLLQQGRMTSFTEQSEGYKGIIFLVRAVGNQCQLATSNNTYVLDKEGSSL